MAAQTWNWKFEDEGRTRTNKKWICVSNLAMGGWKVHDAALAIDASLAGITDTPVPEVAMINLGINDVLNSPFTAEADLKTDYLYIVDAITAKWASIPIYLMLPGALNFPDRGAQLRQWIADIVALRTNLHVGPNESIFLENSDNYATLTTDGTHPTADGYTLTAQLWASAIGI